jgi:hypothetical protein
VLKTGKRRVKPWELLAFNEGRRTSEQVMAISNDFTTYLAI